MALREEGRSYSLPGFPKKEKKINKAKTRLLLYVGPHSPVLLLSRIKQCCGSKSGRISIILQDPDLYPVQTNVRINYIFSANFQYAVNNTENYDTMTLMRRKIKQSLHFIVYYLTVGTSE